MAKHVFRRPILIVVLAFFSFTPTYGQLSLWDFGGYAKNMTSYADGQVEWFPANVGEWQNITQLRLNLFMYPDNNITTTIQSRSLLVYQKSYDLLRQFQEELNTRGSYYFDLRYDWLEESDIYGFSEIDRL